MLRLMYPIIYQSTTEVILMMQQLQFEASWNKAISPQDRKYIEKVFADTKHLNSIDVMFSPIREAINHEEALLITVLIHNFTDKPLTFENKELLYRIGGEVIAEKLFTLPRLVVPSKVSMPWTFIFPKGCYTPQTSFEGGRLEVE